MRTYSQEQTKMYAKCSDVCSCFAADPEDTKVPIIVKFVELGLMDCSDTELAFDGGDQRRTLEESTCEGFESTSELGFPAGQFVMEADDADVFFTSSLLGFDEACGAIDADDEATGDFGVESAGMAGLVAAEDALDPGDDFVGGGVGGLV
jgi:hypothetical protein